jgi:hypothetical protein
MSKHDLAARPIYHHKRAAIEAHLTVVFAALAVHPIPDDLWRITQPERAH